MEKLTFNLDKYQQPIKAPTYYFQSRALAFLEEFSVSKEYKSSIFKWFRKRSDKAEAAFRNMSGKKFDDPAIYFLKLMSL